MYKVYFKGTDSSEWLLEVATYQESRAKEVAVELLLDGYIVKIEEV